MTAAAAVRKSRLCIMGSTVVPRTLGSSTEALRPRCRTPDHLRARDRLQSADSTASAARTTSGGLRVRMSVTGTLQPLRSLSCSVGASRRTAAVITGFGSTSLPGTGSVGPIGGVAAAPNNDGVAGVNPNTVPYQLFFNTDGLLEIEFVLANSGGTTEYRFAQTFFNITSRAVDQLRPGAGLRHRAPRSCARPARTRSTSISPTAPPRRSRPPSRPSIISRICSTSAAALSASSAWRRSASRSTCRTISASVNPYGVNRFTLRQTRNAPASSPVPEPTSFALFGAGLLGMLGAGRRCAAINCGRIARHVP